MKKTKAKKTLRKGKQLSLTNPKNAGRPAIHDQVHEGIGGEFCQTT